MTKDDWKSIKYFTPDEKWGDPYRMSVRLVQALDMLRKYVGYPIIIHCGCERRPSGYHPKGMAVDFHIEGMPLIDQFLAATKFPYFGGVGIYQWWNNPGLHLDIRPVGTNGARFYWASIESKFYVPLNNNFLGGYYGKENKNL